MRKGLVSLVVVLVATLFTACGGGSSSTNEIKLSEDKLGYELTAAFSDKSFVQRGVIVPRIAEYYSGTLLAVNKDSNEQTTFSWSATVDDETFEVTSYRTVVLEAGIYDFTLNLSNDDSSKRYIAEKTVTISDGNQTALSFSLKPVLGDLIVDINVSNEIPRLQLEYKDVSDITDENLTLLADIDGENYTLTINPDTGLSDMYLTLPNGEHNLTLELIDDEGIVIAKKELIDANLSEGSSVYEDLNIDLEPLYGEAMLDLNVTTSSLSLIINIPSAVVDEVGGVENLSTLLTYTENNNTSEKEITDINTSGSDYVATVDLENIEKGSFSFSLDFKDSSDGNALIGMCSVESFNLLESNVTKSCDLTLIKRALSKSGDLLVSVGVNVFDENNLPVVGAEVYLNDEKVGETGSGFGTEGYLNFTHKKGEYTLKATKDNKEGTLDINLTALGVKNYELFLNKDVTSPYVTSDGYGKPWLYSSLAKEQELVLTSYEENESMINARNNAKSLLIGDYIYLFGGDDGSINGKITRVKSSVPLSQWEDNGTLTEHVYSQHNITKIGDYLYSFGATTNLGNSKIILSAHVDSPDQWTKEKEELPELVNQSSFVIIGDYMYLIGGTDTKNILMAKVSSPKDWKVIGSLDKQLSHCSLSVIDQKVYLLGCANNLSFVEDKAFYFQIKEKEQWNDENGSLGEFVEETITISKIKFSSSAIIGDKIYIFGRKLNDNKALVLSSTIGDGKTLHFTSEALGDNFQNNNGSLELVVTEDGLFLFGGYSNSSAGFDKYVSKFSFK